MPLDTAPREHYVQQYDARGHPTNPSSRSLFRSLIHAQNDVLATVGVCVGVRNANKAESGPLFKSEKEHIESVMHENEVGLVVSTVDIGLLFVATWWIVGMRNRMQVSLDYPAVACTTDRAGLFLPARNPLQRPIEHPAEALRSSIFLLCWHARTRDTHASDCRQGICSGELPSVGICGLDIAGTKQEKEKDEKEGSGSPRLRVSGPMTSLNSY